MVEDVCSKCSRRKADMLGWREEMGGQLPWSRLLQHGPIHLQQFDEEPQELRPFQHRKLLIHN